MKIKNNGNNIYYAVDDKHSLDAVNILYSGEITPTKKHSFNVEDLSVEILVDIEGNMPSHLKMVVLRIQDYYFVYDTEKLFKGKNIANRVKLLQKTVKQIELLWGKSVAQQIQNEVYIFAKQFSKQIMSGQLLLA